MNDEKQPDLGDLRRDRCVPVAKKILEELLKADLLLADLDYVKAVTKEQFQVLAQNLVYQHADQVFDLIFQSLQFWYNEAQKKHWEGKSVDEISIKDIDDKLKEDKKIPDEK